MRYFVYKWDEDDIRSYDETYGEGSFDEDSNKASCFYAVEQFGTMIKETDDREEALRICSKAQDNLGYYGSTAIWDSDEQEWFN